MKTEHVFDVGDVVRIVDPHFKPDPLDPDARSDAGREAVVVGYPDGGLYDITVDFGADFDFTHSAGGMYGDRSHFRHYNNHEVELVCQSVPLDFEISEEEFAVCLNLK